MSHETSDCHRGTAKAKGSHHRKLALAKPAINITEASSISIVMIPEALHIQIKDVMMAASKRWVEVGGRRKRKRKAATKLDPAPHVTCPEIGRSSSHPINCLQ